VSSSSATFTNLTESTDHIYRKEKPRMSRRRKKNKKMKTPILFQNELSLKEYAELDLGL